ncbi:MAG: response regulator [Algisphaera sp.]
MVRTNKVYVVDDEASVLESIRFMLESEGYEVEVFTDPRDMLKQGKDSLAGCLITDIRMPGMSGLDMHDRLKATGVMLPTIVVTGHGDVPDAVRAMKSGCVDFIQKPWSNDVLIERVRAAMQMDMDQSSARDELGEVLERFNHLTPRERQVMASVVEGQLNKQIAGELGLSHKTIEVHRSHVMEKMVAGSLAELVRMAVMIEASDVARASEESASSAQL